jgi:tRNA G46 methylase TrmB
VHLLPWAAPHIKHSHRCARLLTTLLMVSAGQCRHHKRRIVQHSLATAIAHRLAPTGNVYLSSDVHEVAVDMRMRFEQCASDSLQVSPLHVQLPTFAESEKHPPPTAPVASQAACTAADTASGSNVRHQQPAASAWAAHDWLQDNPTGLLTEREQSVLRQGLPMYRMLLSRRS